MKFVVGVDEVGRGPLAGPVTVCVVSCGVEIYRKLQLNKNLPKLGKDSKKLKKEERESYNQVLKQLSEEGKISYLISHISNKVIDSKGVSFAIKKAIDRNLKGLNLNPAQCEIRLDGGLKAPEVFLKQKTIIKGDEKEKIIAWASILAKVSRDALMCRVAKKFPEYNFEIHKGYGTFKHRQVIKKYGPSDFHRKSFIKIK